MLPRTGQQGIPLITVNTDTVKAAIYRIGDRNLIDQVLGGDFERNLYGYTLNENGKLVRYGRDPASYQSDVYADKAVEVVRRRAAEKRPFFLWVSFLAPHIGGPPTPGRSATGRGCSSTTRPMASDWGRPPR